MFAQGNEDTNTHEAFSQIGYRIRTVHDYQKLRSTQIIISRWIQKQTIVCLYNETRNKDEELRIEGTAGMNSAKVFTQQTETNGWVLRTQ